MQGRIQPSDVMTPVIVQAIIRLQNDPKHQSDVREMREELDDRIRIWERRGHTYEEALRIMGLDRTSLGLRRV